MDGSGFVNNTVVAGELSQKHFQTKLTIFQNRSSVFKVQSPLLKGHDKFKSKNYGGGLNHLSNNANSLKKTYMILPLVSW